MVLTSVYGLDTSALATAVELLLNHRDLTVQDGNAVAAALQQYRRRPALSFSDCLVLEVARQAGHLPLGPSIAPWTRGRTAVVGREARSPVPDEPSNRGSIDE